MKKVFLLVAVLLVSGSVLAQDVCIQDEKPHYYVAEATTKTTMTDALKVELTPREQLIWQNTYRNFSVVSVEHKDLAACNEALDLLKAKRAIAAKNGIHALQSLSYDGQCLAVEICP